MITLTKEWLLKTIAELEEERDSVPGAVNEDASMALAAMKLALASIEAEAVAFVMADDLKDSSIISTPAYRDLGEAMERTVGDVVALYAIHPAPVSVPLAIHDEDFEKALSVLNDTLDDCGDSERGLLLALDKVGIEVRSDARHAAMLQGAEPVKEWNPCSERMPEREYVLAADFSGKQYPANLPNIQIGIYADWFDDGSPCWDDGDGNDLHLKQVTHWTQIPAAPQQEITQALAKGMERYVDAMQKLADGGD